MLRLTEAIRRNKPDIVHGLLFWAYILGGACAWLAGTGAIVASRRSLGIFKERKPHYLLAERLVNACTTLVIANSEAVRRDTLQREKLSPSKVVVIHNGIDISGFSAIPRKDMLADTDLTEGAGPVVAVVANFHAYKGHGFFLDAWTCVVGQIPAAVALLIGGGPLQKYYEDHVARAGLHQAVRFLGARRDVPELLAAVDLVVHPSLQEGFSNAILEAMAAGKPVIATAVGGNAEAVVHGETGLLVPPRSSQALAQAMIGLLTDPERCAKMGKAGRARVEQRFTLAGMVRSYEQVYEELLDRRDCSSVRGSKPRST
jgi:glycosyltransferase involved in cell wall biosynthesis